MDLKGVGWENMNWIDLAQNRDKWRGLVNVVTKVGFKYNARNFWTS